MHPKTLLLAVTLASCWANSDILPQDKAPAILHRFGRSLLTVPGAIVEAYGSPSLPCYEEGFYSHASDCTKFDRCVDVFRNQHYIRVVFSCSGGTIFSSEYKTCIAGTCSSGLASASAASTTSSASVAASTTSSASAAAAASTTSSASAAASTAGTEDDDIDVMPNFGHQGKHTSFSLNKYGIPQCSSEGRFADPDNCGQYYDCVPSHNGGFVANQQSCFGHAFHPTLKVCVIPPMVKGCSHGLTRGFTDADLKLQHICNNITQGFKCSDCKNLVICIGGKAYTKPCGYGNVCAMKNSFGGGVCLPGEPVECICNETNTFQQDFYNPSKYLSCGIEGTDPIIHSCPEGLVFNKERRACGTGIEEKCTKSGTFAVKDDCTRYFMCMFSIGVGVHREFTCRNKTMFNEETGTCEDPCDWYSGHFKCEVEGRFTNPADCTNYYECTADPINSDMLSWKKHECPEGYEWRQTKRNVGHCVDRWTIKENCVPLKPHKCKIPNEWCTAAPGKIRNVSSKSLTSYSLEVDWSQPLDNPSQITKYTVTWVNSIGGVRLEAIVNKPPYNITGLTACTDYNVTVIAYTEKDPGEPSDIMIFTTRPGDAAKISNVRSKSITQYSLEVDWSQPLDNTCPIIKYTVTWTLSSNGVRQEETVIKSPYNITGLTACTDYNINIIAYTEKGPGEPSDTMIMTTGMDVTGESGNVRSKSFTPYSLEVDWSQPLDNPCPITKYTVKWVNTIDRTEKEATVSEPPYNITSLTACTDYNIIIIAYTDKGPGEPTDTMTLTTGMDVSGKSSNVRSKNITPYTLEVDWNQPLDNPCPITKYTVQWVNSINGAEHEATVDEPPYNITNLTACTDYSIIVVAYTEKGSGEPSNTVTMATEMGVAGKSSSVTRNNFTWYSMEVEWSQPLDNPCPITKYIVKWVKSIGNVRYEATVIEPPYNIIGLTGCTDYNISVIAYTEKGPGETSESVTFTTLPGKSTNVRIKSFTSFSMEVDWIQPLDNPCSITKYTVTWVISSGGTQQTADVIEPPYTITGLTPCTDYNINIIAYTEDDPGEPSDILTSRTTPGKSTNVKIKSFTSSSMEVDWSRPLDNPCPITKYTVTWVISSGGIQQTADAIEPPYTITGLTPCTDYNINIIAYTEDGPGEPSYTLTTGKEFHVKDLSNGFELFNGRVIRRTKNGDPKTNWDDAISFCDQFEAKPFIPRTTEDYQLYKEARGLLDYYQWLPQNERAEEGILRWYTGEVANDIVLWEWSGGKIMNSHGKMSECLMYGTCPNPCVHLTGCDDYKSYPPICEKICI